MVHGLGAGPLLTTALDFFFAISFGLFC